MKLVIKIILASIVSTFAFIGAMGATNPWPAFAVAFGSWFLLIWSLTPLGGANRDKKERERAMEDLMREWERTRRNRYWFFLGHHLRPNVDLKFAFLFFIEAQLMSNNGFIKNSACKFPLFFSLVLSCQNRENDKCWMWELCCGNWRVKYLNIFKLKHISNKST